jgi:hypothetical protein
MYDSILRFSVKLIAALIIAVGFASFCSAGVDRSESHAGAHHL